MDRSRNSCILAAVVLCGLLAFAPVAAEQNIVTVRLSSLDGLLAEVERLGKAAPLPVDRDALLKDLPLGLPGGAWLDGKRPIVAVLPQMGLMAGDKGVVVAMPVQDLAMLIDALGAKYPEHVEEGEIHTFSGGGSPTVYVRPLGGYVAAGAMKNFVDAFDLDVALESADLPPGVIAGEILLEPIAPFVQMTLMQGREAMKQQAATDGMIDVYFDLLTDLMNNVSRLQIAARVEGENVLMHKRLLPRAGSTLAGMLANQSGGLPKIARYVDPADSAWVVAGQVKYTPAFREAVEGYMQRFGDAIESLGATIDESPQLSGFGGWFGTIAQSTTQMLDCYRGDFVAVTRFGESGVGSVNLAGVEDAEGCREALATVTGALSEMPQLSEGGMSVEADASAFDHRGVVAIKQTIRFNPSGDAEQDEVLGTIYGDSGISTYTGVHDDIMLSVTGGEEAERSFRDLVDRLADAKKSAGIPITFFAPLKVGAGFYGRFDLGDYLGSLAGIAAEGEGAAGLDGTIVLGASFTKQALDIELAFPAGLWTGE
jgi:hypothetical protein